MNRGRKQNSALLVPDESNVPQVTGFTIVRKGITRYMDLIEVRSDGGVQMIASGLTPGEVDQVLDWWRYTKPFGPNARIVVRDSGSTFGVITTGTDTETNPPLSAQIQAEALIG